MCISSISCLLADNNKIWLLRLLEISVVNVVIPFCRLLNRCRQRVFEKTTMNQLMNAFSTFVDIADFACLFGSRVVRRDRSHRFMCVGSLNVKVID